MEMSMFKVNMNERAHLPAQNVAENGCHTHLFPGPQDGQRVDVLSFAAHWGWGAKHKVFNVFVQ